MRWISLSLCAVLVLLTPQSVRAQTDGAAEATRRSLIEEAQHTATAGNHAQAVDLATRAGAIRMSPPLRRMIAEQQAAAGMLAEALGSADACIRETTSADASLPGREQHLAACHHLYDSLHPRVGHLRVTIHGSPGGIHVRVAGADLSAALVGVPYVVTPGHVVVDADAPGFVAFHREVNVQPGGTEDVTIDLASAPTPVATRPPATTPSSGATTPVANTTTHTTATTTATPTQHPTTPSGGGGFSTGRLIGVVALGVGAVGALALGIGFNVAEHDTATTFNNSGCYARNGVVMGGANCAGWSNNANTDEIVSIIGYIGAGVFAVGGVVVAVTAPSSHSDTRRTSQASWTCAPNASTIGLSCRGTF